MSIRYLILFISVFTTIDSTGQPLKVSGKVIGEDLDGLPMVNVYNPDTTMIATTNFDGTFELSLASNELLFGFVGMEWEKVAISESCSDLEVILLSAYNYHNRSHRKIDRLRKKQFKNRAELHKTAFEQGIFKQQAPCFDYVFIPAKPDLDEIRNWIKQKKAEINEELKQLVEGDTIYVPYATRWRSDGTDRTKLHPYSTYTDEIDFECMIAGTMVDKDTRGNIRFRVTDISKCGYEAITVNEGAVAVGEIMESNMKYFRVIIAANIPDIHK